MSTNHHTPVTTGAAANAATLNSPLSQLDTKITSQETAILLRSTVWAGKTIAPTVNDDSADGYKLGDRWIDETNNQEYVAVDVTVAAAIWQQTTKTTAVSTLMDSLKLQWDSATSITVGIGSCYAEDGSFIDVTSALVKSALSLTASTWYHVYVYLSGGTPTAEVVTTAPVTWKGFAYSKTGSTSRRYVGSILSDGSGNVRNFVQAGNTILYKKFQSNAAPHRILSAGTATTATAVSTAGILPVTGIAIFLRLANSSDQVVYSSDDNGVGSSQNETILNAGNTVIQSIALTHPLDSSLQVWYKQNAAVGVGGLAMDALGYIFNR